MAWLRNQTTKELSEMVGRRYLLASYKSNKEIKSNTEYLVKELSPDMQFLKVRELNTDIELWIHAGSPLCDVEIVCCLDPQPTTMEPFDTAAPDDSLCGIHHDLACALQQHVLNTVRFMWKLKNGEAHVNELNYLIEEFRENPNGRTL